MVLSSNFLSNNSGILPLLLSSESLQLDLSLLDIIFKSMFFIAVKQLFFAVTAWNDLCFTFYFGSHFESGI